MESRDILQEAKELEEILVRNRRFLHTHAETGFDLRDTKEYVKQELIRLGYEPKDCGRAGLVATIGGKQPGKVFLLRADMDALPIKEEAEVDFSSETENMHACGHDMHTAMLLGAAAILKKHEEEMKGTVKLMFQPAEEIFEGSKDMLKNGLLENPKVDAAMMIHVMAGMPFPAGTVIVSNPGVSAPAADYFEIKVQGKGCHGSMPNTGVDPLNAAAHILLAIQEIQTRELAISESAVVTIGTMHGGVAANVIPDTVTMGGSIRTYDEETRSFLKKRLTEVAGGTAQVFRAKAEVSFGNGCPTLVNDKELAEAGLRYAKELLGEQKAFSAAQLSAMDSSGKASKSGGSEDFAYVSQEVPSIMFALAAGQPEKGYPYPQHHPKVKFDEEALVYGAALHANMALRWLAEQE
ncbi:M20 metallopeptidase family protein [Acetivibrio ethanolgignens]|uniref:Peptidase M20 n=1 Tax=Acetivibrio ethanolgignens TaxID=290052 RepID=A0A0V8QGS6_9FIRM|nr:M20 family metallopeptidase [Acetivibrio ethanolgignens]KSV59660.1 peptidase M20 [Acetivibrio ethanolgignens]